MHSRHCTSKVLKDGKGGGGGQDRDGTHATGWAPPIDRRAERRGRARGTGDVGPSRVERTHTCAMSSEIRDPTSPSPLHLASHRHRGARAPIWHVPGPPGASPSRLSRFWQLRGHCGLPRAVRFGPTITNRHGRQQRPDRGRERATRESRARAARDEPRGAPRISHPRVSSRPRASIRGSRWSFASRSSPAGSVVVGRRPSTLAGTPCRRCRGPHRAPSTVSTRATRARDVRRDVRRDRALVHATLARHSTPG